VFFATVGVAIRARCYYLWSRCYRWLRERGYAGHVPYRTSVDQCVRDMLGFQWRKDGPRQCWDAIGYPRHLEEVGEGDCDEFAVWWLDTGRAGLLDGGSRCHSPIGLLTVTWLGSGHNVAVFKTKLYAVTECRLRSFDFVDECADPNAHFGMNCSPEVEEREEYCHASNWGWFDGFDSLDDIARHVAGRMGKEPLCYSLVSSDLKTVITCKWLTNGSNDSSEKKG